MNTLIFISGSVTLNVTPSNEVTVNQKVTLLCEFDSNPIVAQFNIESHFSSFCQLDRTCDSTICSSVYNASCPSDTQYNIQVTVPRSWNGESVFCQSAVGGRRSNSINFRVTGTMKSNIVTNRRY